VDISDGDLVRLARSGDGAAFRLLVERHRGMARARAARLSAQPDVEDIVQEAFLQAFTGLGRLREPDRFGGWLAGIVRNVSRATSRRDSPVLLGDWPELLHPASAGGLPSAEDLDRAQVLGAAVAGLPAGQRRAVELYYYIDELGPDVPVARITVRGPGGPGQVMVRAGIGLALAALTGAPVRVADALMDRLAVPAAGDDLAALFPGQVPAGPAGLLPGPRNLDFSHGLDGWVTGGSFRARPTPAHWQDYAATARDGAAVLRSAVPAPQGEIVLGQGVAAADYRGAAVTFRGELRADEVTGRAGLFLFVVTGDGRPGPDMDVTGPAITGSRDWAAQELTVQVPGDAELIRIGLSLAGPGQVALRNTQLTRAR
jgi:RNA polymerase sigma factor (sigma-70 family)